MKIGGRYKLIGKRKHAILDLPYAQVCETFENMLINSDVTRLMGSVNRNTGVFKIEYKIPGRQKDTYETYCMLVELTETADGGTRIEYALVYDRLISWYTRFLSVICFIVPLAAALTIYWKFQFKEPVHLLIYVPLLLISAFGVFSLFGYREKLQSVKPMVKEFEQMLTKTFND